MDPVIRIAAATALALLAGLGIAGLRRADPAARCWMAALVLVSLSMAGFVLGNAAGQALVPQGAVATLCWLGAKTFVGNLWLFGLVCFDDDFRVGPLAVAVLAGWMVVSMAVPGDVAIPVALAMMGHLAWTALEGRAGDVREGRRSLRVWSVGLLVGALLLDIGADLVMGYGWKPPEFVLVQNTAALAAATAGVLLLAKLDAPTASAPKPEATLSPMAQRLCLLMERERLHLDPALSLADVVARMPVGERAVRRLINHEMGHGHFRTFLNGYRVEHAKGLLSDPARAGEKIIGVALDSGFASLASFQRAFKANTGTSPSAWRNARLTPARTPGSAARGR